MRNERRKEGPFHQRSLRSISDGKQTIVAVSTTPYDDAKEKEENSWLSDSVSYECLENIKRFVDSSRKY